MKILIVGTGGVGGFYGGLLARAGNAVTFLARGEQFKAMQETGLSIKSVVGDFVINPVQVISALAEAETPELILVCVKSYDVNSIATALTSVVGAQTVVIPLQNGINNHEIFTQHLPAAVVVPGTTWIISQRSAPGLIQQTGGQRSIIFGDKNGQNQELLKAVETVMLSAGIDARNAQDIERQLWLKYLWIVGFAGMTALCRSPLGAIASDPDTLSLYTRCLQEAFAVAAHLNVDVHDEDLTKFIDKIKELRQSNPGARSSMLIDIENHRQTEIESLHGQLCQLAKQCCINVPINEIIYLTVRLSNRSYVPILVK